MWKITLLLVLVMLAMVSVAGAQDDSGGFFSGLWESFLGLFSQSESPVLTVQSEPKATNSKSLVSIKERTLTDVGAVSSWNGSSYVVSWDNNGKGKSFGFRIYFGVNESGKISKNYVPEDTGVCTDFLFPREDVSITKWKHNVSLSHVGSGSGCDKIKDNSEYLSFEFFSENTSMDFRNKLNTIFFEGMFYNYSDILDSGDEVIVVDNELRTFIEKGLSQKTIDPTIGVSTDTEATTFEQQKKIVFDTQAQVWMAFIRDSNGDIVYNWSEDNLQTWNAGNTISTGTVRTGSSHMVVAKVINKASVMFIAEMIDSSKSLEYSRGNISRDSMNLTTQTTEAWNEVAQPHVAINGSNNWFICSGGNSAFSEAVNLRSTNVDTGGSWTAGFGANVVTFDHSEFPTCLNYHMGDSDTMFYVVISQEAGAIEVYNETSVGNSFTDHAVTIIDSEYPDDIDCSYLEDVRELHCVWNSAGTLRHILSYPNGTIKDKGDLTHATLKGAAALTTNGSHLWAFYIDSANDVNYQEYDPTAGTWGGEVELIGDANVKVDVTSSARIHNNSGNHSAGIMWREGTSPFDIVITNLTVMQDVVAAPTGDTCDYTSGDFVIDCTENCEVDTVADVGGSNVTFSGAGHVIVSASIVNYNNFDILNGCTVDCLGAVCGR